MSESFMILAKRVSVLCSLICLGLFPPENSLANDRIDDNVRVEFAVLLDEGDPIAGSALCKLGLDCVLLDQKELKLELNLTINREYDYLSSEITIHCETDCSLSNDRSKIDFRDIRKFDFFEGHYGHRTLLVLKPRKRIGQVILIYQ